MGMKAYFRIVANTIKRNLFAPTRRGDGKVRLHLGCGTDYRVGYVNVDLGADAICDQRMDFTRVGDLYPDDSVSEVVMIHSFGYLRLWQARDLLGDIYRILEPGGRLIMEMPELLKCARRALDSEGDLPSYLEAVRGLYGFDIGMVERRQMFTPYLFAWSTWHLRYELELRGFRQVSICDPQTHGPRPWRDIRVVAVK